MVFLLLLLRQETQKRSWIQVLSFIVLTVVHLFELNDCHVCVSHSVLSFLLHDVLGVLQHLLLPQVKEVGGIGVKLQGLLPIVPIENNSQTL